MPSRDPVRRAAGLGLLAYGIGTPAAFMTIGSPGGGYSESDVTTYIASGHWAAAFALVYVGASAAFALPVVYLVTEMSNLVAVCASAFFVGVAAVVLAADATLPRPLRVATYVGGACGVLAAFFFPLFLFLLWASIFGGWVLATAARAAEPAGGARRQLA